MARATSETRLSALSLRILAVLDHGGWVDQEELVEQVQYSIAPGEAFRYAERQSKAKGEDRRDMDEKIASGRRSKTIEILNGMIQNGRLERRGDLGRGKPKEIRIARRMAHVYVVRDKNDDLHVYQLKTPDIAVHVIDAWARSDNPVEDARTLHEVLETIPDRFPDREEVEKVIRGLISRLNVDAALAKAMQRPAPPMEDLIEERAEQVAERREESQSLPRTPWPYDSISTDTPQGGQVNDH